MAALGDRFGVDVNDLAEFLFEDLAHLDFGHDDGFDAPHGIFFAVNAAGLVGPGLGASAAADGEGDAEDAFALFGVHVSGGDQVFAR